MSLSAHSISKSFGAAVALRDVTFGVVPGEIRALCGENGAGKSTLVKILTGVQRPDQGSLLWSGEPISFRGPMDAQARGIAFVSQELSIAPHLSVYDNIWLGNSTVPFFHRRRSYRDAAREALRLVGLDLALSTPASELSLAERQLLEIARALARKASVIFLDEPTATLSNSEIARVFDVLRGLRSGGTAVVFITHRLSEVFELCDTVTVLRNGRLVREFKVAETTREELVETMLGYGLDQMYPPRSPAQASIAISVHNLAIPGICKGVSFDVKAGEIFCVAGQIGSGASEVVRALAGLVHDAQGAIKVFGQNLRPGSVRRAIDRNILFVSEDRAAEGIFLDLDVADNLTALKLFEHSTAGFLLSGRRQRRALDLMTSVTIDRHRVRSLARELSGGNQQKLAVGRTVVSSSPSAILMNEPTRGVDVGARAEIYRLMRKLCSQGHAIVMSSTDIEEVIGMSDTIMTMFRGRPISLHQGSAIDRMLILSDITALDASLEHAQ